MPLNGILVNLIFFILFCFIWFLFLHCAVRIKHDRVTYISCQQLKPISDWSMPTVLRPHEKWTLTLLHPLYTSIKVSTCKNSHPNLVFFFFPSTFFTTWRSSYPSDSRCAPGWAVCLFLFLIFFVLLLTVVITPSRSTLRLSLSTRSSCYCNSTQFNSNSSDTGLTDWHRMLCLHLTGGVIIFSCPCPPAGLGFIWQSGRQ